MSSQGFTPAELNIPFTNSPKIADDKLEEDRRGPRPQLKNKHEDFVLADEVLAGDMDFAEALDEARKWRTSNSRRRYETSVCQSAGCVLTLREPVDKWAGA